MKLRRRFRYIWLPAVLVAAGSFYYAVDPERRGWFPQCPVRRLTGFDCPGCGAQRALHDLLHGDVAAAAAHNYFLALLVLWAVVLVVLSQLPRAERLYAGLVSAAAMAVYGAAVVVWWVVRNLWGV